MPTERKRLLGNPGKRPLPDPATTKALEPAAPRHLPSPPDHLDERGATTWRHALTLGERWIAETDLQLLTRYCEALDEREELKQLVAKNGLVSIGSQGQEVISPYYKALKDLDRDLTRYEGLLGFTPADRARLGVAEVREQSKLETFLGGGS